MHVTGLQDYQYFLLFAHLLTPYIYIFSCSTTHSDIRPGSGGGAIRLASASGATAFFDPLEVSLKIGTSIDINAPKRNWHLNFEHVTIK